MKTKVTEKEREDFHSLRQAEAQLESIREMVVVLRAAIEEDNDRNREDAERTIQ